MNVMNRLHDRELKTEDRRLFDRFGRERKGNYMHTASGRKYWPFDPRADEIDIEVIAQHLATQARWQGATRHRRFKSKIFLSVAEHSVYVARFVRDELNRPDLELEGLLHDASESYIGDLIRPMKYSPAFRKPFLEVEQINELKIAERFNLVYPFPKEIKMADDAVCDAENQQCIYLHPDEEWESDMLHDPSLTAPYEIQMLQPYEAKAFFLEAYHEAIGRREKYRELPADFHV